MTHSTYPPLYAAAKHLMLPLGVAKSSHSVLPQRRVRRSGTWGGATTTVVGPPEDAGGSGWVVVVLELGLVIVVVEMARVPEPVPMQPAAASRMPAAATAGRWRRLRMPMTRRPGTIPTARPTMPS